MIKKINILLILGCVSISLAYGSSDTLFDFESGSLDGWTVLNQGGGVVLSQEDKYSGSYSVKMVADTSSQEYWDVQLETPQITTTEHHNYKISFWAKAVGGGGVVRLSTESANQLTDDGGQDRQYLPDLNIGGEWAQYTYQLVYGSGLRAGGSSMKLRIDAGKIPGKTYFIDNIEIIDLTPDIEEGEFTNTIPLAKEHSKFLGNIIADNIHPNFDIYWNQVTPENAGKWGSLEPTRDNMNWTALDLAYNHARSKEYKFKFHTFVWGSQEPSWITNLPRKEQKAELEEFMELVAQRYPDLDYIDVVNEPLHQPSNIYKAIGGEGATGWDWIVWSFRKARQLFPNSKLHINDYGIISDPSAASEYVKIVKILQKENLIDGIGIQCHEFNMNLVSVATMQNVLGILAATGLPIYVTELDISGNPAGDEDSQYLMYREKFPVLWEHESVAGVTLWGYVSGATWKTGTGIVESDGTERKAMKWLRSYMASEASQVPNKFNEPTGTGALQTLKLEIYPNPATEFLTIAGAKAEKVEVFDAFGKRVAVDFKEQTADISSLPEGLYVLVVKNREGVFTGKFVKK